MPASLPPRDATDRTLAATGELTTPSGAGVALSTRPHDRVDVYIAPGRALTFQMAMTGAHGALFDLAGGASTRAPVSNDRVSLLAPDGTYLDTTDPGTVRCTTSYTAATAGRIAGTTTCKLLAASEQSGTVTVRFAAG